MIYLDNAATSYPKPQGVSAAVNQWLSCGNPGRSGHQLSIASGRAVMDARMKLSTFFNTSDLFEYIFTANCTEALNLALKGILLPGDHVIATSIDHNSVLRVLNQLEVSITIVSPNEKGFIDPNDIFNAITPDTALVVMSHVSNVTGAVQNVQQVCHECRRRKILTCIDGAQAVGCIPVDLNILCPDMYAFPGHKSLLGPMGTGCLYVRNDVSLTPLKFGGTGSSSLDLSQPTERPEQYESGTLNVPAICGLGAGIEFVSKNFSQITSHEYELSEYLLYHLSKLEKVRLYTPLSNHTGIVAFNIGDFESGYVADILDSHFNICRAGLHCAPLMHRHFGTHEQGIVRASIGAFNTQKDAAQFLKAVTSIHNQ